MISPKAEDLAVRVWFRFIRLESRLQTAVTERLRGIGLSVPQCDVLTTLTEAEGVSQQELAKRLYVTKGNISGLLDRLEPLPAAKAFSGVQATPLKVEKKASSFTLGGIAGTADSFVAEQARVTERKQGDKVTSDLYTGLAAQADKQLWFVEAHLQAKD